MSAQAASWYHCSVKPISRSAGRSVVAAAAYRFGMRLVDAETQLTHDYRPRSGVEGTFIVTPDHAPAWSQDLQALWNAAQDADTRKNSRLARECELALPSSLDAEAREQIARDFAAHLVERYGVAVAVAIHSPGKQGDHRNYHAHILFTTRRMEAEGLGAKTRVLDAKATGAQEVRHLREVACDLINDALADAGSVERVDHRSFKERGIDREGTQHLGIEAAALEAKGKQSRIGDHNRQVERDNAVVEAAREKRAALDTAIAQAQQAEAALPFEERKRRDQSLFVPGPDEAENPPTTAPTGPWEAIKRRLQSAFASPLTRAFVDELTETGMIPEYGLGPSLREQSATFTRNFIYNARRKAKGFWQNFILGRRGDRSASQTPEPDEEPEMER